MGGVGSKNTVFWVFTIVVLWCIFVASFNQKSKTMKLYDFKKAQEIIAKHAETLEEVSLGMHEDWGWTAETIWKDGEYQKDISTEPEIAGIKGSDWATPTIELIFKGGEDKMLPCFQGENDDKKPAWFQLGVLSQPIQDNITPLSEE